LEWSSEHQGIAKKKKSVLHIGQGIGGIERQQGEGREVQAVRERE